MDPPPPPPPPQPPSSDAAVSAAVSSSPAETEEAPKQSSMAPPRNPSYTIAELPPPSSNSKEKKQPESQMNKNEKVPVSVPYSIPQWSEAPSFPFFLEVLKDGAIIDNLDVTKKGAYMFGRIDMCDFILEHPTISRFHAVLQFKGVEAAYLYDLGSTHGTFINKKQVPKKDYVDLHVGDVIRFGLSSRLYIFQGPEEFRPPEADLANIRYAKDREASLRRAKEEAALADGISWGMGEDAIEEVEDDLDEITWQNYKGELTEKQQKTREKVLKRMEKIAHMKKEMAAIRAKDISQGGLTQGQQTQIARNELRISQLLEELESLEETLNDSIRESMGARSGKSARGKLKGFAEDEDEYESDDDEFYDRTKKPAKKSADTQSVETADSLLDKKESLLNEIEEKRRLILEEENKTSEPMLEQDTGDALDAYMSGLSSQLVLDKTAQLEKDISSLQAELDRIVYLLKFADPTGETAKKRATTPKELKSKESASSSSSVKKSEKSKIEQKNVIRPEKPVNVSTVKQDTSDVIEEASTTSNSNADVADLTESKPTVYKLAKPQWLGAVEDRERKENQPEKQPDTYEGDEFVDYKERKKMLESTKTQPGKKPESDLESAAPGLILRKRKPAEDVEDQKSKSESAGADRAVEDAIALLLKHERRIYAGEEEADLLGLERRSQKQSGEDNKRPKRVLGPERPAFLEPRPESDYETWVPPEGQSGDGRTSLNDRLGY